MLLASDEKGEDEGEEGGGRRAGGGENEMNERTMERKGGMGEPLARSGSWRSLRNNLAVQHEKLQTDILRKGSKDLVNRRRRA